MKNARGGRRELEDASLETKGENPGNLRDLSPGFELTKIYVGRVSKKLSRGLEALEGGSRRAVLP